MVSSRVELKLNQEKTLVIKTNINNNKKINIHLLQDR